MTSNDAFLLLQIFRRRALPGLLRKLQLWKGLNPAQHADLLEDFHQELWLDCLQHDETIVALSTQERHARWFRLVETSHYHLHARCERNRTRDERLDRIPDVATDQAGESAQTRQTAEFDPVAAWGEHLPTPQRRFLRELGTSARYLKNGRLNCRESARSMGVRPRELRQAWGVVAEDLGFDGEFLDFWRRRLVEALIGLAADLLRDRSLVVLHGEDLRRRPDPKGRLRRIRRLRDRISLRPIPVDVKTVFVRYPQGRSTHDLQPRAILADAARLAPREPAVHLWMFEASLAEGDLRAAVGSIRAARNCGADRVRERLARARLLEVRGKEATAHRLLLSSPPEERRDHRLARALRQLAG
jgi:hypothetical protein